MPYFEWIRAQNKAFCPLGRIGIYTSTLFAEERA